MDTSRAEAAELDSPDDRGSHIVEDAWYAVLEARRVRRRPVTVERLGRRIVLWRDDRGEVVANDPRCPHRGADLGLGRVVGGRLECPYHGFRFAPDGACVLVPCDGLTRRVRPDMRAATYPVREAHGIVWLWWGAPRDEYPPVPWFEDVPADERHAYTRSAVWRAPFARVVEGNLDIHHFPFLHRGVAWGIGALLDPYEARIEGDRIITRGVLRKDDGAPYAGRGGLAVELWLHFPGLLFGRFSPRNFAVVAMTPIDEERTWLVLRYYSLYPIIGRLVAWLAATLEARLVLVDDERILASSAPPWPSASAGGAVSGVQSNKLVRADGGIALWNKLYRRSLRRRGGAAGADRGCTRVVDAVRVVG
jgi:nitrite reductase/ring-hydroxylating ferredoxin subunit